MLFDSHSLKEKKMCCEATPTFFLLQCLQSLLKLLCNVALFLPCFFYIMSLEIAVSEMIQLIHQVL